MSLRPWWAAHTGKASKRGGLGGARWYRAMAGDRDRMRRHSLRGTIATGHSA
ncbi:MULTISPECIES: hypothetical protein [unclassified Streptomyces]|uniref:hypothetical protein n=1 Tax=unclassified Streptomyces TaxID=2593676 RepID=UPI0022560BDC|nr:MULTISPECIES: hypothetical protein [unclassified Streptomyces]MCX4403199.1 hypothetical protein [Streptomyces sp. NBC_01764]MCX5181826.1 hypothetical protein [Streptomyces sp. NBC_00268]